MNGNTAPPKKNRGQGRHRRNRAGKKTPFRGPNRNMHDNALPHVSGNQLVSPSQVADMMRLGEEAKSGQFAEALSSSNKPVKRERLHKLLAQSGHGSRRDMEILIASGRVMINGNVATAGAHVSPGDKVLIDHRLVPIKFTPDVPRVILYHKPEGEIVSHSDPGNRITVFDNLPRVENGKWLAIGRLDINTSGLLIFTTSGELANRMMHPRFEVEREYAVRILGELTDEQTQRLLEGINIEAPDEDDEDEEDSLPGDYFDDDDGDEAVPALRENRPARFTTIERRAGPDLDKTSANNWYHVTLKEGRNREVRRMFEALGLTVSRLIRVRFGKLELPPQLKRGAMIELEPGQVKDLLIWSGASIEGMDFNAPGPQRDRRGKRGRGGKVVKPGKPVQISRPSADGNSAPSGEEGATPAGGRKVRGRKPRVAGQAGAGQATGNAKPRRGKRNAQGQAAGQPPATGKAAQGKNKRAGQGKAGAGKKSRRGARQAEAPQPRIHRAEPMTAWTGGTAHGIYGRRDGKPARQPRIIRAVTRRPRLPETEGEG